MLIEAIAVGVDGETGQDGLVDLASCPAGDHRAAVQQHFHQADHARVVDFDAGIFCRANSDGQG